MTTIDFYFSFRSPYAWLAYYRVVRALPELATRLVRIPVFPPPSFANDPAAIPAKLAYIGADVRRLAAAYGRRGKRIGSCEPGSMRHPRMSRRQTRRWR